MRIGLVIGKFMPLHDGHISLINFAKQRCDKLIVAVCSLKSEPIDGSLRYQWMSDYLISDSQCNVVHITEELPGSSVSDRAISKIWANYLKTILPDVNVIFASEQYAEYVAEHMNIDYQIYDIERKTVPISATMIRSNPYKYWDYLPDIVKPYYVKTVCLYGGESCGKTTLVKRLANLFDTSYVPEMARYVQEFAHISWQNLNDNIFIAFAEAHRDMINTMRLTAHKVLFVDSDNLTTQIYANSYIGMKKGLIERYDDIKYDMYFLLAPDVPFVQDGTRIYGDKRWEMHSVFKNELIAHNRPFIEVNGDWDNRYRMIRDGVYELLNA
jgi:HTH-type transcriptional repressor of NAD biosynthesis genes